MLKTAFALSFWQIGLITLTSHLTASVLQPIVGYHTDRRPQPYSLTAGMMVTLAGLLLLAFARSFAGLLGASALIGIGASVFHPESSRVARLASGGQHGLAQSLFQTGGNAGSALGPLLAALVVLPRGQSAVAWFSVAALVGVVLLWRVGVWYHRTERAHAAPARVPLAAWTWPAPHVRRALAVLVALVFSKYVYLSSLTTYLTSI
jgi:FSR family fosmidomycin resistance protein-like MFS transporter